jgi:hypothetical protein
MIANSWQLIREAVRIPVITTLCLLTVVSACSGSTSRYKVYKTLEKAGWDDHKYDETTPIEGIGKVETHLFRRNGDEYADLKLIFPSSEGRPLALKIEAAPESVMNDDVMQTLLSLFGDTLVNRWSEIKTRDYQKDEPLIIDGYLIIVRVFDDGSIRSAAIIDEASLGKYKDATERKVNRPSK